MTENQKEIDAVGEVIRKAKRRRSIDLQAKIVGWLIVVLLVIGLVLLFTKTAHSYASNIL